jgi:hypothetical protein
MSESTPEIDVEALESVKHVNVETIDNERETPVWEADDAPPGSTSGSLLVYEKGKPVRVSGPTHYHHLANGAVVAAYSGGTHHTEPGPNGRDKVTRIVAILEG